eukprot:354470-Chlamydomonas_euryale.AAC.3
MMVDKENTKLEEARNAYEKVRALFWPRRLRGLGRAEHATSSAAAVGLAFCMSRSPALQPPLRLLSPCRVQHMAKRPFDQRSRWPNPWFEQRARRPTPRIDLAPDSPPHGLTSALDI